MDHLNNIHGFSISVFRDTGELFSATAEFILKRAETVLKRKRVFSLVLSGGNTPAGLYKLLTAEYSNVFPWNRTVFFWGDERCVPPDNELSNYHTAYEYLLGPLGLTEKSWLRMKGELGREKGAAAYEKSIRDFFSCPDTVPEFDCILLGVGNDGHTASLFPGSPVLSETECLVAGITVPEHTKPDVDRITMTIPVFLEAGTILFLASGSSKKEPLERIFRSNDTAIPAGAAAQGKNVFWHITKDTL